MLYLDVYSNTILFGYQFQNLVKKFNIWHRIGIFLVDRLSDYRTFEFRRRFKTSIDRLNRNV